jgi:hypothetical protein
VPCPHLTPPLTYNSVASLHVLNNFSFHEQRSYRIHAYQREQKTTFSLKEVSYIRIFVPPFDVCFLELLI